MKTICYIDIFSIDLLFENILSSYYVTKLTQTHFFIFDMLAKKTWKSYPGQLYHGTKVKISASIVWKSNFRFLHWFWLYMCIHFGYTMLAPFENPTGYTFWSATTVTNFPEGYMYI